MAYIGIDFLMLTHRSFGVMRITVEQNKVTFIFKFIWFLCDFISWWMTRPQDTGITQYVWWNVLRHPVKNSTFMDLFSWYPKSLSKCTWAMLAVRHECNTTPPDEYSYKSPGSWVLWLHMLLKLNMFWVIWKKNSFYAVLDTVLVGLSNFSKVR